MNTFIYTISDEFGNIRYIGKSNNIESRLKSHISEKSNMHKYNWLNSIINRGEYPIIEVLEEVPADNWQIYEMYWISQFKSWGFNLLNMSEGGVGRRGYSHTDETKKLMREKKLGVKRSAEHRQRISVGVKKLFILNPLYNRGAGNSRIRLDKEELYIKYIIENLSLNMCAIYFKVSKKTIFTNITEYGFKKDRSVWKHQLSARSKKSVYQYDKNLNLVGEFESIASASKLTNIDNGNITKCCHGQVKSAGGFIWQFA